MFDRLEDTLVRFEELLSMLGQLPGSNMSQIYTMAFLLSLVVMGTCVMMISSSLNSNVSQRMEFFGLLRCLGATRRQVLRFVRREALQWCITAIPIGIGLSIVVVWGLCAVMRQLSTVWFGYMPIFGISWLSIGVSIGTYYRSIGGSDPRKNGSKGFTIGGCHRQYTAGILVPPCGKHSAVACRGSTWYPSCQGQTAQLYSDDRCICNLHHLVFRVLYAGSLYGKRIYAERMVARAFHCQ